jgi:hypothetical protein
VGIPIANEVHILITKVKKLEKELRVKRAIKVPVGDVRRFPRVLRDEEGDLEDNNKVVLEDDETDEEEVVQVPLKSIEK